MRHQVGIKKIILKYKILKKYYDKISEIGSNNHIYKLTIRLKYHKIIIFKLVIR